MPLADPVFLFFFLSSSHTERTINYCFTKFNLGDGTATSTLIFLSGGGGKKSKEKKIGARQKILEKLA